MNVLPLLENGLFALGQVLRFPVMVLLWVCVASALFMAGHCPGRSRGAPARAPRLRHHAWLKGGRVLEADASRLAALASPAPLARDARRRAALGLAAARRRSSISLLEREERARHATRCRRACWSRSGPASGLLGTLIPMGTSLASLATGNLEAMAGQMVVAFTTHDHRTAPPARSPTWWRPRARRGSPKPFASSAFWPNASR